MKSSSSDDGGNWADFERFVCFGIRFRPIKMMMVTRRTILEDLSLRPEVLEKESECGWVVRWLDHSKFSVGCNGGG